MPTVKEHNQCLRLKAAELLMHRPGTCEDHCAARRRAVGQRAVPWHSPELEACPITPRRARNLDCAEDG